MLTAIEGAFKHLCLQHGRRGTIGAVPLAEVRFMPEQIGYLRLRLSRLGLPWDETAAVSLSMAYEDEEIRAIPREWGASRLPVSSWNEYAKAYGRLNSALDAVSRVLAAEFHGVSEGATLEGLITCVNHVRDYFSHCASHRSVAEAVGIGWRGRHGLIVTPEFGPAVRFATLYVQTEVQKEEHQPMGCGECRACLDACPVLSKGVLHEDPDFYRELCRRYIRFLALDDEVCGICVRRCWETVMGSRVAVSP